MTTRNREEIVEGLLKSLEAALGELGIAGERGRSGESIYIPNEGNEIAICAISFPQRGDYWQRFEQLDKPAIRVISPRLGGRVRRFSDAMMVTKAATRVKEILAEAVSAKTEEDVWADRNGRVANLIAEKIAESDASARKFGWTIRYRRAAKGYGKLEIVRPGADPQALWQESWLGIRFPRVDAEGKRLPACEGDLESKFVSRNPIGNSDNATLAETAAALTVLFDTAKACDDLVKEI